MSTSTPEPSDRASSTTAPGPLSQSSPSAAGGVVARDLRGRPVETRMVTGLRERARTSHVK